MAPPPNLDVLLVQIQFPGMAAPESAVFREWLTRHGAEYDRLDFNVRLGEGVEVGEGFSPEVKTLATTLTQKRADVVGWQGVHPTIFEVKIRASLGALGQLLGYLVLFPKTFPGAPPPHLVVLARRVDNDSAQAFAAYGVDVLLYEET